MAKTVEELEAELLELGKSNDALANKNKEILDELKKERRTKNENSGDLQKYYELQDKYDALKDEKTKLEHEHGKALKQVEKFAADNETLNGTLTRLIKDDGITNQLAKIGVKPEYMEATKALLRDKVDVVENKAVVGDKGLEEFMKEWSTTDGKAFIAEPANGGGGANGGNGLNGGAQKEPEKGSKEWATWKAEQLINKEQ